MAHENDENTEEGTEDENSADDKDLEVKAEDEERSLSGEELDELAGGKGFGEEISKGGELLKGIRDVKQPGGDFDIGGGRAFTGSKSHCS